MNVNGWHVTASDDGQYLYIELDGAPGQIHVKAEDEGFVVDIWSTDSGDGNMTYNVSAATCSALYTELEPG